MGRRDELDTRTCYLFTIVEVVAVVLNERGVQRGGKALAEHALKIDPLALIGGHFE